jgi:hypothetical protein
LAARNPARGMEPWAKGIALEFVLELLLVLFRPASGTARAGKWALSLVGLKASVYVEAVIGIGVWTLGLVGIVCAIAVFLSYRI